MAERRGYGGKTVYGARVGILGLTFKEDVPDLRNTKVLDIVHELRQARRQMTILGEVVSNAMKTWEAERPFLDVLREDLDLDGKNETVAIYSVVTVAGYEAVTGPMGTFPDCVRIETETTETITLSALNVTLTQTTTSTLWRAPGVGGVKGVVVSTQGNRTRTKTYEVIGYTVDGRSEGMMPENTVWNPAGGNSESSGKPVNAQNGSRETKWSNSPYRIPAFSELLW